MPPVKGLMSHLNGNLLAAVTVKTTGVVPFHDELVSIAVVILDTNLNFDKRFTPFSMSLVPLKPENISSEPNDITAAPDFINIDNEDVVADKNKLEKIIKEGINSFKAAELFEGWFETLPLKERKKISPLAFNWKFCAPFIMDWLSGPLNMDYIFDSKYRDIATTALFLNDYYEFHQKSPPYPKINRQYLASQTKLVDYKTSHQDSLADCVATVQIYKSMLRESIIR
jgi:hypothetical protein